MKITLYTITDCQFSKQEKDFLKAHNLPYEEKNLETNKEFLAEMLAVSNNFAGTPVTKIEKDDGQITVLKGFTEAELGAALDLAPTQTVPTATVDATMPVPTPPPAPPSPKVDVVPTPPEPTPPPVPTNDRPIPTEPAVPPVVPVMPEPSIPPAPPAPEQPAAAATNDALNSILNDLQAKSAAPTPAAPAVSTHSPTGGLPNIPDFSATT